MAAYLIPGAGIVQGTTTPTLIPGAGIVQQTETAATGQPTQQRTKAIPGMNLIAPKFGRGW